VRRVANKNEDSEHLKDEKIFSEDIKGPKNQSEQSVIGKPLFTEK